MSSHYTYTPYTYHTQCAVTVLSLLIYTGGGALGVLPLDTHGPIGANLPILHAHGGKSTLPSYIILSTENMSEILYDRCYINIINETGCDEEYRLIRVVAS